MSWMLTATGAQLNLVALDAGDISMLDIAHHLSMINRWTGATCRPYSVAEHSLLVVEIMERELAIHSPAALLAGLLHDAHEAYVGDMATPLKNIVGPAYVSVEDSAQAAVMGRFGALHAFARHQHSIKMADLIALATEQRDLVPGQAKQLNFATAIGWLDLRERDGLDWRDWRQAFLDRYEILACAARTERHGRRVQA